MATAQSQLQNRLALVSSLYGPGTITCWYLTILSVLLSWTLHPRKRKSGSIDVDLIAILTLPAVAAGHLVSQVQALLNQDKTIRASSSADLKYIQSVAAIEASFNVTETFMAISVILFVVATWTFCVRRAVFVALVGLLCFTIESYIHFSEVRNLGLQYSRPDVYGSGNHTTFTRYFVADFASLVIIILATLSFCSLIGAAIAICMLRSPRMPSSRSQQDTERVNEVVPRERITFTYPMLTTAFLPVSLVASLMPPILHRINYRTATSATMSFWQTLGHHASRLARDFFPRTGYSITDLDQAVAAAAGVTVLGFSVYSMAKAPYKTRNSKRHMSPGPAGIELSGFENRPAP